MKRPAFQFYPADWTKDLGLRSCSLAARGLWMELLCMAHESETYGHLVLNGKALTNAQIINTVSGATAKMLHELEAAGVFSRTAEGTIYSRRMVRDEATRNAQARGGELGAEHGAKGGAHGAKGGRPRKDMGGNQPPSDGPEIPPSTAENKPPSITPSSSSSSSSSKSDVERTPTVVAPVDNSAPKVNGAVENIDGSKAKGNGAGQEWGSEAWVAATAMTVGKPRQPGEPFDAWKDRVYGAVQAMRAQAAH